MILVKARCWELLVLYFLKYGFGGD